MLQDGYVLTLHRDECILVHSVFEKVLQDSRNKEYVVAAVIFSDAPTDIKGIYLQIPDTNTIGEGGYFTIATYRRG